MSGHKYPYIPKKYYKPVMFACKMIRETGYFNKAINTAARYYGVDADEVAKHVRARQGAGQKGKTRSYNIYGIVALRSCIGGHDLDEHAHWSYFEEDFKQNTIFSIKKATSESNAIKAMRAQLDECNIYRGIGGDYYIPIKVFTFDSEEQAKSRLQSLEWEPIKEWIEDALNEQIVSRETRLNNA